MGGDVGDSENLPEQKYVDVLVVGAGTAGLYAAWRLRKLGLSVTCVDRVARGRGGAQWVNGVPAWSFAELGLKDRSGERGDVFSMGPASGSCRYTVHDNPVLDIDMRDLNEELLSLCERAGVELWFDTSVVAHQVDAGGLRQVSIRRGNPGTEYLEVCARLFVDASGLKGALKKSLVSMCEQWPEIAPSDLCAAAQYVMKIDSIEGARKFLKTTRLADKEAMGWLGGYGGFSLLRVHVDLEHEHVSLLTGSIAEQGIPSGKRILQNFVEQHDWIGAELFGGSRVIPLRRAYSVLGAGRIALVGDSASQVFAPHGSGIAMGMLAGKHLAETLASVLEQHGDIGSDQALWGYSSSFHETWGGILGFADAFRRFSQSLSAHDMDELFRSGLMTPHLLRDGLTQLKPSVDLASLPLQARAIVRLPRLGVRLVNVLGRLPLCLAAAAAYPKALPASPQSPMAYELLMRSLVDTVSKGDA